MREIKFRAWDRTNKQIFQVHSLGSKWSSEDGLMFGDGRFPIMQYTGLKDKNGKEIYEGDIVQKSYGAYPVTVSEFHGYRFMWGLDNLCKDDAIRGEVIGNIYVNPELLEVGE